LSWIRPAIEAQWRGGAEAWRLHHPLLLLIEHFDGHGSVSNVQKAVRDIALLLEKFKNDNEDVRGAYIDVIEAEIFIQGTTYDVTPNGERPRR
jgi:hypothetical protein